MAKKKTAKKPAKKEDSTASPAKTQTAKPKEVEAIVGYEGLIAVKKSPTFSLHDGDPLEVRKWGENEVVAVDPKELKVQHMLKRGNLQFVADRIRAGGDKPRILKLG